MEDESANPAPTGHQHVEKNISAYTINYTARLTQTSGEDSEKERGQMEDESSILRPAT